MAINCDWNEEGEPAAGVEVVDQAIYDARLRLSVDVAKCCQISGPLVGYAHDGYSAICIGQAGDYFSKPGSLAIYFVFMGIALWVTLSKEFGY
jgi:hypothetical protein